MAVNILQIHWSNRNFQITGGDCDDQVGCQKNHQFPLWTFDIQVLRYMHLQALTMSTEHQGAVWQCVVLENIETLTTGNFK